MYLYSLGLPEDAPQFDLLFQSRPLSSQNPRVSLALYHSARLRLFGVRLPRPLDPRPRALVVRLIGARAGLGVTLGQTHLLADFLKSRRTPNTRSHPGVHQRKQTRLRQGRCH